jgi:serine protease AprX
MTAESIGADQVWAGTKRFTPFTGQGVSVAVIDSGIDTRHNSLRNRVLVTHDFTGGDGRDGFGHGTHVAGIIAGQVGRTDDTREYRGIASGAYLLNLRVLGDDGSGVASDVIEAIDWTIAHREQYNVRIINLSLGTPVLQPYRDDPLCEAVERAVRAGISVVVAAGNYGRTADGQTVYGSIASPGNSPHAITVGAIDTHGTAQRSDDTLAPYSSRGPTRYDLILKPDVAAPGSHIVSAESADSYMSKTYPERHVAGSGANAYMQLSGTSMAAGVVSGAAALVLDAQSSLTPRETRVALQLTSTFLPSAGAIGAGAGMINVLAAVELAVTNKIPTTTIAGENAVASRLITVSEPSGRVGALGRHDATVRSKQIMWGSQIMRGAAGTETIIWGTAAQAETIIWGTATGSETIIWGTASGSETIIWGTGAVAETIIWGTASDPETIIWGTANAADALF